MAECAGSSSSPSPSPSRPWPASRRRRGWRATPSASTCGSSRSSTRCADALLAGLAKALEAPPPRQGQAQAGLGATVVEGERARLTFDGRDARVTFHFAPERGDWRVADIEVAGLMSVVFCGDGKSIVSAGKDGTIRVWKAADGSERARFAHDGATTAAVSPDGCTIASGSADTSILLWDVTPLELGARK